MFERHVSCWNYSVSQGTLNLKERYWATHRLMNFMQCQVGEIWEPVLQLCWWYMPAESKIPTLTAQQRLWYIFLQKPARLASFHFGETSWELFHRFHSYPMHRTWKLFRKQSQIFLTTSSLLAFCFQTINWYVSTLCVLTVGFNCIFLCIPHG